MKAVIQRCLEASVSVDGAVVGRCGHGLMILLGVQTGDTDADADMLAQKIVKLRIFCDEADKMNLSITDIGGSCLVISQFTLCASCRRGNRPDFLAAAAPAEADRLYQHFLHTLETLLGQNKVEHGIFGADMKVSLINDGPVTLWLDTDALKAPKHAN